MKKEMLEKLNEQINNELFSSYAYLAMAAYFNSKNLNGFAGWFYKQAEEERAHAMKIFHYLFERGEKVSLKAIAQPTLEWKSTLEVFKDALKHEKGITKNFNDLTNLAISQKDHATQIFLQWFVKEQVEEEASVDAVIQKLEMIEESVQGLLFLDSMLGKRE